MISALKKLAKKNEDAKSRAAMPSGVTSMGQSLQRKFGRGVQYNMKIVIKGDRNTGKSSLFGRFQGKPFKEEYIPTNEIQVCSINWNYRVADDVVKVEVWDVVDKGKRKSRKGGLKLANELTADQEQLSGLLDAEFLDVYKGTHGCIMMMDITKQWTFKYIERELPKIPNHIPVLVLANYCDMAEHRVVQLDEITEFIKSLERPKDAAIVEYGECCMKNSFGLKFIHKFFNIPFLKLQRETLEKQLKINEEDMESTLEELSFHRNSEEQDYDKFLAYLEKKMKEKKQPASSQVLENERKSSSSSTPNSSTTSLKKPSVPADKIAVSSKLTNQADNSIDDFVPNETIDSEFLEEAEKGVDKKSVGSKDGNEDSESDNEGNPMVSGFQDISSSEEDEMEGPQSSVEQKRNVEADVDIEITSDESEREVVTSPVVKTQDQTDSEDEQRITVLPLDKPLEAKSDVILNDEDDNFMNAWLDSPSTNPQDVKKSDVKSSADVKKSAALFRGDEFDAFEASQLNPKSSSNKPGDGEEENSSGDRNEEKKKRHSERRNKGEEGKHRHRSKHKHKKKSKRKDSDEEESGEKKSKSKKKHRHKHSKSREKKETDKNGEDYESF